MHYLTRHLEALTEFSHGRRLITVGEPFQATDIDATYYIDRGMARETYRPPVQTETAEVAQPFGVQVEEIVPEVVKPSPPPAPEQAKQEESTDESAQVRRRPGRPSRAEIAARLAAQNGTNDDADADK